MIKPKELSNKIQSNNDLCLIDVRSEDEHKSGTIQSARCIPHGDIGSYISGLPKDKEIILFCKSGKRSSKAIETLKELNITGNVYDLEGGFEAWQKEGLPIHKYRNSISIQRQVMITAGLLMLTGTILGLSINKWFFAIPIFVSSGLIFAGISDFCGMAILLEKMPWNKTTACKQ